MSLRVVVAAPFRSRGRDRLAESEFVVALSLDRDWFSPDQASRVADLGMGRGLLERDEDALVPTFDVEAVDIPTDFAPDEGLLQETSPFEQVLDALVGDGWEKQEAVAGINRLQADLAITIEAAAVVFARQHGVSVDRAADRAQEALTSSSTGS